MEPTMDRDAIIAVLNDLIEISKDGERGFRTAADDVEETPLKQFFLNGAQQCKEGARELKTEVLRAGGDPERSGSVAGALHRGWVEVKSMLTGRNAQAVLDEVERGEDAAVRAYRAALEKPLPHDVRSIVQRQFEGVIANHDRVKVLCDQYRRR